MSNKGAKEILGNFIAELNCPVLILPYSSADDANINWFVWLINVPEDKLIEVDAFAHNLLTDEDNPTPFLIGAATPEKTKILLDEIEKKWVRV